MRASSALVVRGADDAGATVEGADADGSARTALVLRGDSQVVKARREACRPGKRTSAQELAIWVHLHGLTSNLVLWMRAGAGPLGAVAFCDRGGRYARLFWHGAREMCAPKGTGPC